MLIESASTRIKNHLRGYPVLEIRNQVAADMGAAGLCMVNDARYMIASMSCAREAELSKPTEKLRPAMIHLH